MVGIGLIAALYALEYLLLLAVVFAYMSALRTGLTRVCGLAVCFLVGRSLYLKARRIISGIAKPVILCKNHDKITRIITDNNLLLKIF